jgi:hypothetical protein
LEAGNNIKPAFNHLSIPKMRMGIGRKLNGKRLVSDTFRIKGSGFLVKLSVE